MVNNDGNDDHDGAEPPGSTLAALRAEIEGWSFGRGDGGLFAIRDWDEKIVNGGDAAELAAQIRQADQ